jgi:hypothetical protein
LVGTDYPEFPDVEHLASVHRIGTDSFGRGRNSGHGRRPVIGRGLLGGRGGAKLGKSPEKNNCQNAKNQDSKPLG